MNLSEEKKEPLRLQPNFRKKEMLAMHMKGTVQVTVFCFVFYPSSGTMFSNNATPKIDNPYFQFSLLLNVRTETSESIRHAAGLHRLSGQSGPERPQDLRLHGVAEDRPDKQSAHLGPRLCLRGFKSSFDHPQRMLQKVA